MKSSLTSIFHENALQTSPLGLNSSAPSQGQQMIAQSQEIIHSQQNERFEELLGIINTFHIPKKEVEGFRHLMNQMAEIQSKYQETKIRLDSMKNITHLGLEGSEEKAKKAEKELHELRALKEVFDTACYKDGGSGASGYMSRLWSNETWEEWTNSRTNLGRLVAIVSDYTHSEMSQDRVLERLKGERINLSQASKEATDVLSKMMEMKIAYEESEKRETESQFEQEGRQLGVSYKSSFLTVLGGGAEDDGHFIQEIEGGGFVLTGTTKSYGAAGYNVLVAKLDEMGAVSWAKALGGSGEDKGRSIRETQDGGFVLMGHTKSYGAGGDDGLVVKLNATGSISWAKTLERSNYDVVGYDIQETQDGGFVLTGYVESYGAGNKDILLVKLNKAGNISWEKTLEGSSDARGYSIQETQDTGFVLIGYTSHDVLVAKMNATGSISWAKTLGGSSNDRGYSIQETQDGGFVLTGSTKSYGAGGSDALVVKLNETGAVSWAKALGGGPNGDYGDFIQETQDGGFILTGYAYSYGVGGSDVLVVKLNSAGGVSWAKTLGGSANDRGRSIQETQDGGFVLTGYLFNSLLVAKLDKNGDIENCADILDASPTVTDISSIILESAISFPSSDISLTTASIDMDEEDIMFSKSDSRCYADSIISTSTETTTSPAETSTSSSSATGLTSTTTSFTTSSLLTLLGGSGNDRGYSILETQDGGVVLAGHTDSYGAGKEDIFVAKLDKSGVFLWVKTLGGVNNDEMRSIQETQDRGFVLTGFTESYGSGGADILVVKMNETGDISWAKALGGSSKDWGISIQETQDKGFVLTGYIESYGAGNKDILLVKLDEAGNVSWEKTLGGPTDDRGYSIQETQDGGFVLSGITWGYGAGNTDVLVVKLNATGALSWAKTLGASGYDTVGTGDSIQVTQDGGFVLIGYTDSYGIGSADVQVVKMNETGALSWAKALGGSEQDGGASIQETRDRGFVLTGQTASYGAGVLVAKLNETGGVSWAKALGESNDDRGRSIQETQDGGFVLTGWIDNYGAGSFDVLLAKLDENGEIENCTHVQQDISPTVTDISSNILVEDISDALLETQTQLITSWLSMSEMNILSSLGIEAICESSTPDDATTISVSSMPVDIQSTAAPKEPATISTAPNFSSIQKAETTAERTISSSSILRSTPMVTASSPSETVVSSALTSAQITEIPVEKAATNALAGFTSVEKTASREETVKTSASVRLTSRLTAATPAESTVGAVSTPVRAQSTTPLKETTNSAETTMLPSSTFKPTPMVTASTPSLSSRLELTSMMTTSSLVERAPSSKSIPGVTSMMATEIAVERSASSSSIPGLTPMLETENPVERSPSLSSTLELTSMMTTSSLVERSPSSRSTLGVTSMMATEIAAERSASSSSIPGLTSILTTESSVERTISSSPVSGLTSMLRTTTSTPNKFTSTSTTSILGEGALTGREIYIIIGSVVGVVVLALVAIIIGVCVKKRCCRRAFEEEPTAGVPSSRLSMFRPVHGHHQVSSNNSENTNLSIPEAMLAEAIPGAIAVEVPVPKEESGVPGNDRPSEQNLEYSNASAPYYNP